MIRRYLGLTLIAGSMAMVGCSSSDDNDDGDGAVEEMPVEMMPEEMMPEEMMPAPMGFTAPADATGGLLDTVSPELFMALDAAGITALPAGNFTIFEPSADALAAAQEAGGALDPNLPDADRAAVLQLHVLEGVFAADPGDTGATAVAVGDGTTLGGETATIADGGSGVAGLTFGGANLTAVDAFAENGVVHSIDGVAVAAAPVVMMPPPDTGDAFCGDPNAANSAPVAGTTYAAIAADPELSSFRALLEDASLGLFCSNLNTAGNNWTVFAPNNTAVDGFTGTLSSDLLAGHIHTGGQLATIADLAAADATTSADGTVMLPGLLSATSARLTIDAAAGTVNTLPIVNSFTSDTGAVHVISGIINPNP